MAIINPQIPIDPNVKITGGSQPIDQPQPNLTTATTIKGIGDIFGNVVKGADQTLKSIIDYKAEQGADTIQTPYIKFLEDARGGSVKLPSILDNADPEVPDALGAGIDRLENLQNSFV